MYQEVVQLGEGACPAHKLDHAGDGLWVSVEVSALSATSKEHVGKVRGWVENRMSTCGKGSTNGKGA